MTTLVWCGGSRSSRVGACLPGSPRILCAKTFVEKTDDKSAIVAAQTATRKKLTRLLFMFSHHPLFKNRNRYEYDCLLNYSCLTAESCRQFNYKAPRTGLIRFVPRFFVKSYLTIGLDFDVRSTTSKPARSNDLRSPTQRNESGHFF